MTVGRKPLAAQQENKDGGVVLEGEFALAMSEMRSEALSISEIEQQRIARVRVIAAKVGYQLPADCADPDLIQRDVASNMRRSVEACLEVGRGLTALKAACEHGEFIARLDVLSIERTVAKRFMQAAAKFSNGASTHLLKAAGNQTKLFEMLVLDDDQIEELELTGQTGELKLDDVASMSVKELRAKVRELKGEVQSKEDVLATRAKQLNEAEEKAIGFKKLTPEAQLSALLASAGERLNDALCTINGEFRQALLAITDLSEREVGIKDFRPLAAGLVGQLQQSITTIRDEFLLTDIIGDGVPEWMRATAHLEGGE